MKTTFPFLFGIAFVILFWDMMGIYVAIAEGRSVVPEPFPLLGFGEATLTWFYGQYAIFLFFVVLSWFLTRSRIWIIGSALCSIALFLDFLFLSSMLLVYLPMLIFWALLLFIVPKKPYLAGSILAFSLWQLDKSVWGAGEHPLPIFTGFFFAILTAIIVYLFHETKARLLLPAILGEVGMVCIYLFFPGGECTPAGQTEVVIKIGSLLLDKATLWYSMEALIVIFSLISLFLSDNFYKFRMPSEPGK